MLIIYTDGNEDMNVIQNFPLLDGIEFYSILGYGSPGCEIKFKMGDYICLTDEQEKYLQSHKNVIGYSIPSV